MKSYASTKIVLAAKTKTRGQRELEAEATAYVVMRHFGIEHLASNYLATYNVDGDQLRDSLETISGAAKRLIAAIETRAEETEATEKVVPDKEENAAGAASNSANPENALPHVEIQKV